MEWIELKDKKPDKDIVALVCNEKGYMWRAEAIYDAYYDIWKLSDPNYRESLTLDITHYIEIPPIPRG